MTVTSGGGGFGGRNGACSRGFCTFFRFVIQKRCCRRAINADRMAFSNTSFTPKYVKTLVS